MGSGTSGKGSSSSRTAQQTTTNTMQSTINTVDNRAVEGDHARIGGNVSVHGSEGVTITTTDQGAVQAGLDLALESLGTIKDITNTSQSVQRDVTYQAFDLADKARQSETSNAIQSVLKYGAIIAVLAILAWAYSKRRS
jgi:hypothetical protein